VKLVFSQEYETYTSYQGCRVPLFVSQYHTGAYTLTALLEDVIGATDEAVLESGTRVMQRSLAIAASMAASLAPAWRMDSISLAPAALLPRTPDVAMWGVHPPLAVPLAATADGNRSMLPIRAHEAAMANRLFIA
jgi:hypothetical protein